LIFPLVIMGLSLLRERVLDSVRTVRGVLSLPPGSLLQSRIRAMVRLQEVLTMFLIGHFYHFVLSLTTPQHDFWGVLFFGVGLCFFGLSNSFVSPDSLEWFCADSLPLPHVCTPLGFFSSFLPLGQIVLPKLCTRC